MLQNRLVDLLGRLIPEEGVREDVIPGVNLFRITKATPRVPLKYDPGIIILAQGKKKVYVGDDVFVYDPLHYLVLSVPLPIECETTASEEKPMLGLRIGVDAASVGEILLAMEDAERIQKRVPTGIYAAPLDARLTDGCVRLLETVDSPQDSRVLGPMLVREIIYRVLCGEKGHALRALAFRNQHFFQISRILDRIHAAYGGKLDMNTLAREAGMSISAFHTSFKAVTNSSPLQYIKNVRLHKARFLMIEEGENANTAAYRVGYESPSQFNREYKRLFGLPPARDALHA